MIDLADLPCVSYCDRRFLPRSAGAYIVLSKAKVLYVGISYDLRIRWRAHEKRKLFGNGFSIAYKDVGDFFYEE